MWYVILYCLQIDPLFIVYFISNAHNYSFLFVRMETIVDTVDEADVSRNDSSDSENEEGG